MRKKRISVIALMKILGLIILALVHMYSILFYIYMPRQHKSPLDFPNSVWECEYNGATITLLVREGRDRRGYVDRDGERTYLAFSFDTRIQVVVLARITEEEFYGEIYGLSDSQTILNADFRCTDTKFTVKGNAENERELDFWQREGPIKLVFYRVSE